MVVIERYHEMPLEGVADDPVLRIAVKELVCSEQFKNAKKWEKNSTLVISKGRRGTRFQQLTPRPLKRKKKIVEKDVVYPVRGEDS